MGSASDMFTIRLKASLLRVCFMSSVSRVSCLLARCCLSISALFSVCVVSVVKPRFVRRPWFLSLVRFIFLFGCVFSAAVAVVYFL